MMSDIMTLITVKWSLKPPSERYPTGFGKIESLGSLGVSSLLLMGGLGIGWSAVLTLSQQFAPELADMLSHFDFLGLGHGHGHDHGGHSHSASHMAAEAPSLNAAWLLFASAGVKEWLVYASKSRGGQSDLGIFNLEIIVHFPTALTSTFYFQRAKLPVSASRPSSIAMPCTTASTATPPS